MSFLLFLFSQRAISPSQHPSQAYRMSTAIPISLNIQPFTFCVWQVGYLLPHSDVKLMSSFVLIGRLRMGTLVIYTTSSELYGYSVHCRCRFIFMSDGASYLLVEIYWWGSFITLIVAAELFKMLIVKLFLHKITMWCCSHKQVLIITTQRVWQSDVWPFVCGDGSFSALQGCYEISVDEWIMNPKWHLLNLWCEDWNKSCAQLCEDLRAGHLQLFHKFKRISLTSDCPQRPLEKRRPLNIF